MLEYDSKELMKSVFSEINFSLPSRATQNYLNSKILDFLFRPNYSNPFIWVDYYYERVFFLPYTLYFKGRPLKIPRFSILEILDIVSLRKGREDLGYREDYDSYEERISLDSKIILQKTGIKTRINWGLFEPIIKIKKGQILLIVKVEPDAFIIAVTETTERLKIKHQGVEQYFDNIFRQARIN